ncbi:MAG TPA: STAS domain-containing protein [Candidatus Baltobacteraceae bacterium]|nr:STAS domain-containing protein [Candidatus Baltobacteraceae bacterium]
MESVVIEYQPNAYPALEAAVVAALREGADRVVLNLDSLDSLDTDGVRGLIALLRRSRAVGGELALRSSKPGVRRTLEVTALDRIFQMVEAEAA